jgi:formylglycine-generating enzyme required for sulfatase activity
MIDCGVQRAFWMRSTLACVASLAVGPSAGCTEGIEELNQGLDAAPRDAITLDTAQAPPDVAGRDAVGEDAGGGRDSACEACYPDAGVPPDGQVCPVEGQACSGVAMSDEVCVPGGTFTMGTTDRACPSSPPGAFCDEPSHRVATGPFFMDRTEVTNARYQECVAAGVCDPPEEYTNLYTDPLRAMRPVVAITHPQASTYCAWRGRRLPTEAEWEHAARGPAGLIYSWGGGLPSCQIAALCTAEAWNAGPPEDVGSHPADMGATGVLDLGGSVSEWIADVFDEYAYLRTSGPPPFCDPLIADRWYGQPVGFVVRGCDYLCGEGPITPDRRLTFYRGFAPGDTREPTFGFRCARSAR